MSELLAKLPDSYFKGFVVIASIILPYMIAKLWRVAKREGRLEADVRNARKENLRLRYDVARMSEIKGFPRGLDEAPRLRKLLGIPEPGEDDDDD